MIVELSVRRRRTLRIQRFRPRGRAPRPWLSIGPVHDDQRLHGIAVLGPRGGLAVYLYPSQGEL